MSACLNFETLSELIGGEGPVAVVQLLVCGDRFDTLPLPSQRLIIIFDPTAPQLLAGFLFPLALESHALRCFAEAVFEAVWCEEVLNRLQDSNLVPTLALNPGWRLGFCKIVRPYHQSAILQSITRSQSAANRNPKDLTGGPPPPRTSPLGGPAAPLTPAYPVRPTCNPSNPQSVND